MNRLVLFLFVFALAAVSADHFYVKEGSRVCIIMDANITGKIHYEKTNNKTEEYQFNVTTTKVGGDCSGSSSEETLEISFYPNNSYNKSRTAWSLTMRFSHEKTKSFLLKNYMMKVYFYSDLFNTTESVKLYTKSEKAETDLGAEGVNGFRCSKSILSLDSDSTLKFENLRLIAFANISGTEFAKEQTFEQCTFDAGTSEIVPIVVGACLAVLVTVVLIAYLIGRAHPKRQGYASV